MRRQLLAAVKMFLVFTVLCGILYTFAVTGLAQVIFHDQANGSLVKADGRVVGSKLIGQNFTEAKYFHPRPSAAGTNGYDADASASSNLGPTNPELLKLVRERAIAYRKENGLAANALVPSDAVTASGSGLDPQISVANARLQAPRVAKERGVSVARVNDLIDQHTEGQTLGFLGEKGVNVLELNLALDKLSST
jgi:potassium-transporting ATPase KdpC subunit